VLAAIPRARLRAAPPKPLPHGGVGQRHERVRNSLRRPRFGMTVIDRAECGGRQGECERARPHGVGTRDERAPAGSGLRPPNRATIALHHVNRRKDPAARGKIIGERCQVGEDAPVGAGSAVIGKRGLQQREGVPGLNEDDGHTPLAGLDAVHRRDLVADQLWGGQRRITCGREEDIDELFNEG
jgi:hypothetical protein